jgi:hypothetical protein
VGPDRLTSEFAELLTPEILAYVASEQEKDPSLRFTVVITPNVIATSKEIATAARALSPTSTTFVDDSFYAKYPPGQLSGTGSGNDRPVRFSLVPGKLTPELTGAAPEQQAGLKELQTNNPGINLGVPSVLEAIAYWHTLKAVGILFGSSVLTPEEYIDLTYVRHSDLSPQTPEGVGGGSCVPFSVVNRFGGSDTAPGGSIVPGLRNSLADASAPGRVIVRLS